MKRRKLEELREKGIEQLIKEVDKLAVQRSEAYSKLKAGKEKNLKAVKNLKRDIAQILTIIHEKQSEEKEISKKEK